MSLKEVNWQLHRPLLQATHADRAQALSTLHVTAPYVPVEQPRHQLSAGVSACTQQHSFSECTQPSFLHCLPYAKAPKWHQVKDGGSQGCWRASNPHATRHLHAFKRRQVLQASHLIAGCLQWAEGEVTRLTIQVEPCHKRRVS